MLFNSYVFLFMFLPVCLAGFYLLCRISPRLGMFWLSAMSIVYYGWWEPPYLLLLFVSVALNYSSACAIAHYRAVDATRGARMVLVAALLANLLLLGYFKYFDFLLGIINQAAGTGLPLRHIVLPLAISFYTLVQIAFLCDIYQGKVADLNLPNYVLFVTFFPHMIAGPIIHHSEMMPQFRELSSAGPRPGQLARGLFLFVIGLFKKVCIADSLAVASDAGFRNAHALDMAGGWMTALCYQLQLYFDFSGYSDMAIGLALMFGIVFPLNFNSPYKATDIRDFWHRWHMTLSRFLRDYVYVPAGGNRAGRWLTYRNLLLTFVVGGIWHGAGWPFLIWGIMHGAAMAAQRLWSQGGRRLPMAIGWLLTFVFVMLAFVMFRAPDTGVALTIFGAMLDVGSLSGSALLGWRIDATGTEFLSWIDALDFARLGFSGWVFVAVCLGICVSARNSNEWSVQFRPDAWHGLLAVAMLLLSVLALAGDSPFIYFQF